MNSLTRLSECFQAIWREIRNQSADAGLSTVCLRGNFWEKVLQKVTRESKTELVLFLPKKSTNFSLTLNMPFAVPSNDDQVIYF